MCTRFFLFFFFWSDFSFKLEPIIDDREYLEDQHLLLAVKSNDGMESFGTDQFLTFKS